MTDAEETRRLQEQSRALSALVACRSIEDVAAAVRHAARVLVGADGIAVVVREGKMVRYLDEDAIGPLWKGQSFPIATCVSGLAMLGREMIVIDDIASDPRVPMDLYRSTFVRSMAMAPVGQPDPVAAVGAYWASVRTPTPRELASLEAMALAAALAFELVALRTAA
jgi:GAF domain-containing protein